MERRYPIDPIKFSIDTKDTFRIEIADRLNRKPKNLLVGLFQKGGYKLNKFYDDFTGDDKVILVEIYENLDTRTKYSRIYTRKTSILIPTICFGPIEDIKKMSERDNLPMIPFNNSDEIKTESGNLNYVDLRGLPGMEDVFENAQRCYYIIRPSSYLLTNVWDSSTGDIFKRNKVYDNIISGKPETLFFGHITSPDELQDLCPQARVYGVAVTNSIEYSRSHKNMKWYPQI